jgi:hypothetical protein
MVEPLELSAILLVFLAMTWQVCLMAGLKSCGKMESEANCVMGMGVLVNYHLSDFECDAA